MNSTGNQKKLYLLALILLIIAVALACIWTFWAGGSDAASGAVATPAPEADVTPGMTPEPVELVPEGASPSPTPASTVSTIVYYQDNYGYLVPVMCNVAYEDGIAKATLNLMVKSSENDMAAARLGLRTVLPEGTKIDLDICDGVARIDLSGEVLKMSDAAAENGMVSAIVQALTEFESVKSVEFMVDGQKLEKLTHGTDLSKPFVRGELNPETEVETAALTTGAALSPVKLYFPCDSGSVVVPVTRMVYSKPDLNTAVLELTKGPSAECPLERTLPAGCGLIDVKLENGVAKLNFTGEFARLVENSDGGRMALKALVLTCTQFDGVERVEVLVEGQPYDPGSGTLNVPGFANVANDIVYDYIQTQSQLMFDFE